MEGVEGGFMEIEISGYKVLIDDEDWERVKGYSWTLDNAYLQREGIPYFRATVPNGGKGETVRLHRVIMGCIYKDGTHVDHINHDTLDNRKHNLRVVSPRENKWNQTVRKDNISGYKGVSYKKAIDKYVVRIQYGGKRYNIGTFNDPIEAAKVYDRKALEVFGEFAITNFPKNNYIKGATN